MGTNPLLTQEKKVVIFDTSCLLCNRFVMTLLRNDNARLHYTGFESEFSKHNLPQHLTSNPETVLFIENEHIAVRSEAVFAIIRQLKYPVKLFMIFSIIPKAIADYIYDWIARNRYSWFGQADSCFVPTEEVKSRFLD